MADRFPAEHQVEALPQSVEVETSEAEYSICAGVSGRRPHRGLVGH